MFSFQKGYGFTRIEDYIKNVPQDGALTSKTL
jgi:hypothetical protein